MPKRDLHNEIAVATSVDPAGNRTATVNGTGVDLAGYNAAAVAFVPAAITDGTHTPKLQESDDNATWNDVAAADQLGSLVDLASDTVQEVSYNGTKRYIRAVVTVAGGPATGGIYAALVVRGAPKLIPVS